MPRSLLPQFTLLSLATFIPSLSATADLITDWNLAARDAIRAAKTPPPAASRALAITHTAAYDALIAGTSTHNTYRPTPTPSPDVNTQAAAAAAAHRSLSALFPASAPQFDSLLNQQLTSLGGASPASLSFGQSIADSLLTERSTDGHNAPSTYTPSTAPGRWRPTPPTFAPALLPQWANLKPFGIASPSAFIPGPPPALNTPEYAAAVNEVRLIGSAASPTRTPDQTQIARFWANGAGTETPPGHWNRIALTVAQQQNNSLQDNARMLALLNLSLADAAITSWNAKYTYDLWRPVDAIRLADTDDNPLTSADPTWSPLLITPPFPEYTSGHSTFSGAGAAALASFFGNDAISFTTGSDDISGVLRSYDSFSDAALESGLSRIYGGIHFSFANTAGLSSGAAVGQYISANFLTPIPEPATASVIVLMTLSLAARRPR
jgi:membrane-associated phospholipid phosphatase